MKIQHVGAEIFHEDGQTAGRTDGQTDMTKLIFFSYMFRLDGVIFRL